MRDASVAAAQSKLDLLKSQTCTLPCTRVQWAVWLGENVDELRMRMQTRPRCDGAPSTVAYPHGLDCRLASGSSQLLARIVQPHRGGSCWSFVMVGMASCQTVADACFSCCTCQVQLT